MKKLNNVHWLVSLIVLSALTAWVYFSGDDSGKNFNETEFTLELNSVITSVKISSGKTVLNFDYVDGEWTVNDSFLMDPGMRDAFFTVISSIRIRRAVGGNYEDSIATYLETDGLIVEIFNNADLVKSYLVGGDETNNISYFMNASERKPYEVILPGYDSYVAGIYSVPEMDWRNRFLFELDWSNLKSVKVDYLGDGENLEIDYKENFFYLNNTQNPIDSALMFDYIGELRNLQVQKYAQPGMDPILDSLITTKPKVSIAVEVIGIPVQQLVVFDRIPGNRWVFGKFGENMVVQFDPRSLVPILIQPDALER